MASLEEALTQSVDNEPIAPVNDVLVIDPEKRLINVPDSESLFGVFGENIVERKYFTCPRIILNNIDLFECYIFINYISASGRIGYIQANDVVLDETENYIVFSWELTSNVFDKNMDSIIYFSVSAKQYVDDREPVFFTRKAQGKMYETVNGTELIQEQYADIILQLLAKIESVEQIATPEAMQVYVDNWLKENPSAIGGQPVPVESASGMLNTQTLYLYMGKGETVDGVVYERGYVYYYVDDTQSWTKGSLYGGEGGGSSFSGNASDVSYDDTETKLGATNVQEAVGRLSDTVNNHENRIKAVENNTSVGGSGVTIAQVNSLWEILQKTAFVEAVTETELNKFKVAWGLAEDEDNGEEDGGNTGEETTTYVWEKYEVETSYDVTEEFLGTSEPYDSVYVNSADGKITGWWTTYSVNKEGKFEVNGDVTALSGYRHIKNGDGRNIYRAEWKFVYKGDSYTNYYKLSVVDFVATKGASMGNVSSNSADEYPADGIQDGYWYVLVEEVS